MITFHRQDNGLVRMEGQGKTRYLAPNLYVISSPYLIERALISEVKNPTSYNPNAPSFALAEVDLLECEPPMIASDLSALLKELNAKFFYLNGVSAGFNFRPNKVEIVGDFEPDGGIYSPELGQNILGATVPIYKYDFVNFVKGIPLASLGLYVAEWDVPQAILDINSNPSNLVIVNSQYQSGNSPNANVIEPSNKITFSGGAPHKIQIAYNVIAEGGGFNTVTVLGSIWFYDNSQIPINA